MRTPTTTVRRAIRSRLVMRYPDSEPIEVRIVVDRWQTREHGLAHRGLNCTCATLVVAAPAKVNLFLHVTGRRADGYHTCWSRCSRSPTSRTR